ncbi:hemin uptake protein HemP [Lampropedia puyangensis]|uniref:Hemin uptake protein HemP n=1 Tax=Lampropedia puyangensis TaxID=1330072 RepID=A0A4V6T2K1_9BURK|nr:hemin uptake protein HemP [Lampropedia puyangensis]THT96075.1 hemin uptake protein HemP [Lampropedia puyangensis]
MTLTTKPSLEQAGNDRSAASTSAALESLELLKGQKSVTIHHNGSLYRLQATKLGKLILTK